MQLLAEVNSNTKFQITSFEQKLVVQLGILAHLRAQVLELLAIGVVDVERGHFQPIGVENGNHLVEVGNFHHLLHAVLGKEFFHIDGKNGEVLHLKEFDVVERGMVLKVLDGGADVLERLQFEKQG